MLQTIYTVVVCVSWSYFKYQYPCVFSFCALVKEASWKLISLPAMSSKMNFKKFFFFQNFARQNRCVSDNWRNAKYHRYIWHINLVCLYFLFNTFTASDISHGSSRMPDELSRPRHLKHPIQRTSQGRVISLCKLI